MKLTNDIRGPRLVPLNSKVPKMGYTQKWWEKNKDSISAARRKRYQEDPEYRKSALAHSKAHREKKRKEREAFRANPTMKIGNSTVPALTIDHLEQSYGITKARLKYLQKAGYIPAALVVRPLRLYTHNQLALIQELESYLADKSQFLRATRTKEGQDARAGLDALTTKIKTAWKGT